MADDNIQWITVNGRRIPLMNGESKDEAIKKAFEKKDSDIEKAKKQAKDAESQKVTDSDKSLKTNKLDEKQFNKAISNAKDSRPKGDKWRVDVHTPEEYEEKGCKCFTTDGGSTIAITKDGDIISVCKNSSDKISGKVIMAEAVRQGGKKLDSFRGNHEFYVACGFEPVSWTPFNKEYAPDGWKESGCSEEPVIFYKYVGVGNVKNVDFETFKKNTRPFTGDDGYDKAMAYRDKNI